MIWSTGRGTFGGEFGARNCNQWGLTFAATRPSSQITLGRLVYFVTSYIYQKVQKYFCIVNNSQVDNQYGLWLSIGDKGVDVLNAVFDKLGVP